MARVSKKITSLYFILSRYLFSYFYIYLFIYLYFKQSSIRVSVFHRYKSIFESPLRAHLNTVYSYQRRFQRKFMSPFCYIATEKGKDTRQNHSGEDHTNERKNLVRQKKLWYSR